MYTSSSQVVNSTYIDIDFSEANFSENPIIVVSTDDNVNTSIASLTSSTARIKFSSTFTGRVSYIIREKTI